MTCWLRLCVSMCFSTSSQETVLGASHPQAGHFTIQPPPPLTGLGGLIASDMLKAGLRQTGEALEAVRIDGGTGCDVLGEERPRTPNRECARPTVAGANPAPVARGWARNKHFRHRQPHSNVERVSLVRTREIPSLIA